jgi:hypothetical protein
MAPRGHPAGIGIVGIATFAPDAGEPVASLIVNPPPGVPAPILPLVNGFLLLDKATLAASLAADAPNSPPRPLVVHSASRPTAGFGSLQAPGVLT